MRKKRESGKAERRKRHRSRTSSAFRLFRRSAPSKGFTLLEALMAIGLAAVLLAVYGAMLTGVFVLRRTGANLHAAHFIQEELDALRSVPYDDITIRTDGPLLGTAFQRGDWAVADAGGDKVLRLSGTAASLLGETGLVLLPGDYRDNYTVSANVRADASSPAGWDAGIMFRYRDAENHYRFRFSSGGFALDEVARGITSTLWSQSTSLSAGTWYALEVQVTDDQITLRRDGLDLVTHSDQTFVTGDIGIFSGDDALTEFDDVAIDAPTAESWDFEAESVGVFPSDWRRLSYDDLPDGNATLTVENHLGQSAMKKATVTVSWSDGGSTRSNFGVVIIAK